MVIGVQHGVQPGVAAVAGYAGSQNKRDREVVKGIASAEQREAELAQQRAYQYEMERLRHQQDLGKMDLQFSQARQGMLDRFQLNRDAFDYEMTTQQQAEAEKYRNSMAMLEEDDSYDDETKQELRQRLFEKYAGIAGGVPKKKEKKKPSFAHGREIGEVYNEGNRQYVIGKDGIPELKIDIPQLRADFIKSIIGKPSGEIDQETGEPKIIDMETARRMAAEMYPDFPEEEEQADPEGEDQPGPKPIKRDGPSVMRRQGEPRRPGDPRTFAPGRRGDELVMRNEETGEEFVKGMPAPDLSNIDRLGHDLLAQVNELAKKVKLHGSSVNDAQRAVMNFVKGIKDNRAADSTKAMRDLKKWLKGVSDIAEGKEVKVADLELFTTLEKIAKLLPKESKGKTGRDVGSLSKEKAREIDRRDSELNEELADYWKTRKRAKEKYGVLHGQPFYLR